MYKLTKNALLYDLYYAFVCAKRHKKNKQCVLDFEKDILKNLLSLCDELYERRYKPLPSVCFIIEDPKKREVFAANFRDRIVHHLYYNYVYDMFDSTLIEDSYSCRIGRGTHYGVDRLSKHIRQETENYTKTAYALKMDIKGYFMHIDRIILLDIVNKLFDKMEYRQIPNTEEKIRYCDEIDFDFMKYLSKEIIMLNPTENCIMKSSNKRWRDLEKSLFYTSENCGLPIGNLTSQLFSNIYMNVFDQYVKRELKCKHYGRYVDDFYIIMQDKERLVQIIGEVKTFLKERLHLDIQNKKTHIVNVKYGVEFLGGFVKPHRNYISNKTLKRLRKRISNVDRYGTSKNMENMINSYLGTFSHYKSFNIRKSTMEKAKTINQYGEFNDDFTKFVLLK